MNDPGKVPVFANDGNISVYTQIEIPAVRAVIAPFFVLPFQKIPPKTRGANWAIATKDINPEEINAKNSPIYLK